MTNVIPSTYNILMWVHEHVETKLFRNAKDRDSVLYPILVVLFGPCVFDGFPGEDVPNSIVAHLPQSGEVEARVVNGEGPANKGYVVSIEEIIGDV